MMPPDTPTERVRQGESRGNMRTVVLVSTVLAIMGLAAAWFLIR